MQTAAITTTDRLAPAAQIGVAAQVAPVSVIEAQGVAAPFAQLTSLIKTVFSVKAVAISLDDLTVEAEAGVYPSYLDMALERAGAVVGNLRLLDSAERVFTAQDRVMLAGFAGMVLEQAALWRMACRDALTGALTRRAFEPALERAFASYQRRDEMGAVILFDLDHFKRINDSLGHAAGDAVLRATAAAVQAELRSEDAFGRIGGEEFAVVLRSVSVEQAQAVAERLRAAIEAMAIAGYADLKVTSSFGFAMFDAGRSGEALLAAADAALYEAKASGRNRVARATARASKLN